MSGVTIVSTTGDAVTIVQGVENAGPPGPAVIDASYLVLATNTTLTAERVLTAGTGIDITDAGAGSTVTVDVDPSEFGNGTVPIASLASTPLLASNNLSDVTAATARTNLGLGDSATKNVGTGAGSVAAGDHNHTGVYEAVGVAAALVDDLSGVSNAATARTNLGLGGLAVLSAVGSSEITNGAIVNDDVNASAAIALSKLASISTARILGRTTAGSGAIEELTQAGVFGFLGTGTPGASNFLRGDGTWSTPAGGSVATDTIFDAKGDLAVGTGADTASKLTVGTNDMVLKAASGEATGAKWDYAVPPLGNPKNGATTYYATPGVIGIGPNNLAISTGCRHFFFFWTPTAITVDQIAIEQYTAAAAGKLFRLGLIAADKWWQPTGTAIMDSGNFAADGANGVKTYTPGSPVVLPAGRYLGTVHSDGSPQIRAITGGSVGSGFLTTLGATPQVYNHRVSTALAAVDTTPWDTANNSTVYQHGMWLRLSDPTS